MRMLGEISGPLLSCGNPGKLFTADRHWWKSGEVKICPPGRGDYLWFVPHGGDDPSLGQHLELVLARVWAEAAWPGWRTVMPFPTVTLLQAVSPSSRPVSWGHSELQWSLLVQYSLTDLHQSGSLHSPETPSLAKARHTRHESWSPPVNLKNQEWRIVFRLVDLTSFKIILRDQKLCSLFSWAEL